MDDLVPHLVKVPCDTRLSLWLLPRTCHINPANVSSSNKLRDLRGDEGLENRKITAKGWVCPGDESLLLLKREMLTVEPALSLVHEYKQGMHKAKATPGSVFRKKMENRIFFFS